MEQELNAISKDLEVKLIDEERVAIVAFNKPKKYNAITFEFFADIKKCFEMLGRPGSTVRAIVLKGNGKHFTAGLDL